MYWYMWCYRWAKYFEIKGAAGSQFVPNLQASKRFINLWSCWRLRRSRQRNGDRTIERIDEDRLTKSAHSATNEGRKYQVFRNEDSDVLVAICRKYCGRINNEAFFNTKW